MTCITKKQLFRHIDIEVFINSNKFANINGEKSHVRQVIPACKSGKDRQTYYLLLDWCLGGHPEHHFSRLVWLLTGKQCARPHFKNSIRAQCGTTDVSHTASQNHLPMLIYVTKANLYIPCFALLPID